MKPEQDKIREIARYLDQAEMDRELVAKVTQQYVELGLDEAYEIQRAIRSLKEARGIGIPGYKVGLTSTVKLREMGLAEPLCGFLTDYGAIADGGEIPAGQLTHPRIEMELAFTLRHDLRGPDCDAGAVLDATAYVSPAMEIIDSRYPPSAFDLVAAIADNVSTARYVVGVSRIDPRAMDLTTVGGVLERNGEVIATGAGAAVMGHPANSLACLVRRLWRHGDYVPAGSLVLTGGLSDALPVRPGDVISARFSGLGSVSCRFG